MSSQPAVPAALRQPLTRIGARLFFVDSASGISEISLAAMASIDNETNAGLGVGPGRRVALFLPDYFDLSAVFIAADSNYLSQLEVSGDSTNGHDGTWTLLSNDTYSRDVTNTYRNGIDSYTATMVRWLKLRSNSSRNRTLRALHVFGGWSTGVNQDRLIGMDPVDDLRPLQGPDLDFGDIIQGTTHERDFRVKNNSSTLTAQGVELGLHRQNSVMEYSTDDGVTWLTSVSLGDIAPGAITPIIKIRRVVGATADPGLGVGVLTGEATAWVV